MTGRDAPPDAAMHGPQLPEPEQWGGHVREPCPTCGSSHTTHVLFGMQVIGTREPVPNWISFGGCCPLWEEPERSCSDCGHEWSDPAEDDESGVDVEDDLYRIDGRDALGTPDARERDARATGPAQGRRVP